MWFIKKIHKTSHLIIRYYRESHDCGTEIRDLEITNLGIVQKVPYFKI